MKIECVGPDRAPREYPFPTEPLVIDEGNGRSMWFSPPIQSGKRAWRCVAMRYKGPDGEDKTNWWLESTAGWKSYVSRENWAAMVYENTPGGRGNFSHAQTTRPPKALYLRWWREMTLFLHEGSAKLAEILAEIDGDLDRNRQEGTRKRDALRAHEDRFGRVEHGDMMVLERPLRYESFGEVQAFVMLKRGRGLDPHVHARGADGQHRFYPVRIRRMQKTGYMKVGPAAFEVATNISNHEKLRLMALATEIRAYIDAGGRTL